MRKNDFILLALIILFIIPFFLCNPFIDFFSELNHNHAFVMAYAKFAVLATLGELIGLRIRTGTYFKKGFGIIPRAIVWGFIGLTIKGAFIIFSNGTPFLLEEIGLNNAIKSIEGSLTKEKILVAFFISTAVNLIYAPIMMTFHKIMDIHIVNSGGTLKGLFTKIHFKEIIKNLNWGVQWNFVFKKTIPFFWIPAHTLTFLLPADFQVLFAALLGIALGVILSLASLKSKLVII